MKTSVFPNLRVFSILLIVVGVLLFAVGIAGAANPSVDLEQCANGGSNETNQCLTDPGGPIGWVKGNSNANKSTYAIGEFIAYRFIFDNLTAGATYCGAFGWDITQGSKPAIDYVATFNETMALADPTLGTSFAGQVASPTDTEPVPPDPVLTGTMAGNSFTGSQLPGVFSIWGATFTEIPNTGVKFNYNNDGSVDLASGGNASKQSVEYCYIANGSQVLMSTSGHIADPADWGGLPRPSGSPYHRRYGSAGGFTAPRTSEADLAEILTNGTTNHYNFGNIEVQLDVSDSSGQPTAITLKDISVTGGGANIGIALAAFGLLLVTVGILFLSRKRQVS